jgi:hypothetical protein
VTTRHGSVAARRGERDEAELGDARRVVMVHADVLARAGSAAAPQRARTADMFASVIIGASVPSARCVEGSAGWARSDVARNRHA